MANKLTWLKNKLIIDKIIDLQSNPVEKNPYKTGGITKLHFVLLRNPT